MGLFSRQRRRRPCRPRCAPFHGLVSSNFPLVVPGGATSADPGPTSPCTRAHGCRIAAYGGVRHDGERGASAPLCMGSFRRKDARPMHRPPSANRPRPSGSFVWGCFRGKKPPRFAALDAATPPWARSVEFPTRRPGRRVCGDPGPTVPCARKDGCRTSAFGGVRHDKMKGALHAFCLGLLSGKRSAAAPYPASPPRLPVHGLVPPVFTISLIPSAPPRFIGSFQCSG